MARVEIAVMGKNQTCKIPLVNGKTGVFASLESFFCVLLHLDWVFLS